MGYPDYVADRDGLERWRATALEGDGHDMAHVNKNSLLRFVQTIDNLETALASITRERDEAQEENERLTALFASEDGRLGEIVRLRKEVATRTRERDAMLEALRPFAALAEYYRIGGPLRARTGPIMGVTDHRIGERELTVEHLFNAAALVNGEGWE